MPRWLCRWRGQKQISTPKSEDLIRYEKKILHQKVKISKDIKKISTPKSEDLIRYEKKILHQKVKISKDIKKILHQKVKI